MKFALLVFLPFFVFCATPYQPNGFRGGYYDYRAGKKNVYIVGFRGNGYIAASTAGRYAHRRASDVCTEQGYKGYKILDQKIHVRHQDATSNTSCYGANCYTTNTSSTNKPTSELLVECE